MSDFEATKRFWAQYPAHVRNHADIAKWEAGVEFIKLVTRNDWGVEYYAHPDDAHATSDARKHALAFKHGDRIGVKWPDGSVTVETVKHSEFHQTVSDHGHSSDVTSRLAGFARNVRGIASFVRLDAVEVAALDVARVAR